MHSVFFTLILSIALVDLLVHRDIGAISVVMLYVAVRSQADSAAARLLRQVMKSPSRVPYFFFENPERPIEKTSSGERPYAEEKTAKIFYFPTQPRAPDPTPRSERPRVRLHPAPFRSPNFQGSPHEVLGIDENAATAVIVGAFRHWIKRHHPDHAAPHQAGKATERARRLTAAKEFLLDRRKRLRAVA